jgi:hypothetical protein
MPVNSFEAIAHIDDIDVWKHLYEHYAARHLRIKLKNSPLYLTLFGIKIFDQDHKQFLIKGDILSRDADEDIRDELKLNVPYDFVFQEGKIYLGTVNFFAFGERKPI